MGSGLQNEYNITLHPLNHKEDTTRVLKAICDYAESSKLPVKFTLENQRYKDEYSINGDCKSVGEIVKNINSRLLMTCFDFGHFLSNKKNYTDTDILTEDFSNCIRHTHIHSFYEGRTHFPLDHGETELEENLGILIDNNYSGILSLEISFPRFLGKINFKDALCNSISILKTAYKQTLIKKQYLSIYKDEYQKKINNITRKHIENECFVGQLISASYIVKLGNTKFVVDPSLSGISVSDDGRKELLNLIKECGKVIITHKHRDHFDPDLIRELSSTDIQWFSPDFFTKDNLKECNLNLNNVVFTKKMLNMRLAMWNYIFLKAHIHTCMKQFLNMASH